jgi:hypothetical protein
LCDFQVDTVLICHKEPACSQRPDHTANHPWGAGPVIFTSKDTPDTVCEESIFCLTTGCAKALATEAQGDRLLLVARDHSINIDLFECDILKLGT